jgi:D-alanyl-D-alanine dipeptidase
MATLSGRSWVSQFPNSASVDDLVEPFRANVKNFLAALQAAGATVSISATLRPPERAYLMHFSYKIAKGGLDPSSVPAKAGVGINWVWTDAKGKPDVAASRKAANEMVAAYGIVYAPALTSRHSEGKAIDVDISWTGALTIVKADKSSVTIKSDPKTGGNSDLQAVGAGYGVIKLATDPPHWSSDGH